MYSAQNETLIPKLGVVTDVRVDTPDVKTFRVNALEGGVCFKHIPGQCAMLSIPGVGEAMFSITSSPTDTEYMAHWPGICLKHTPPSSALTRKVLTSGVSTRTSVTTPSLSLIHISRQG